MSESGLPNVTTVTYYGLVGPPGTPADVVGRLNTEVNESLQSPELVAAMTGARLRAQERLAAGVRALIAEQSGRWGPIVKRIAFQME